MQGLEDWIRRAHAGAESPDRPNHYKELGLRCDCDTDEVENIRKLMAYNLRSIVYQKLLPTLMEDVPRIPAVEILLGTPAVQKYILEAREGELLDIIRKSHEEGMVDFTTSLVRLVETEWIHHKVALEATPKPEELKMRLKGIS